MFSTDVKPEVDKSFVLVYSRDGRAGWGISISDNQVLIQASFLLSNRSEPNWYLEKDLLVVTDVQKEQVKPFFGKLSSINFDADIALISDLHDVRSGLREFSPKLLTPELNCLTIAPAVELEYIPLFIVSPDGDYVNVVFDALVSRGMRVMFNQDGGYDRLSKFGKGCAVVTTQGELVAITKRVIEPNFICAEVAFLTKALPASVALKKYFESRN